VKDKVVARWREEEIAARLKTKATEMLDKIKAGTSFADATTAEKLKVEWRLGIKRGGGAAGLPPAAIAEVFRTPQDGAGTAEGGTPAERLVFRVTEIKVPSLDPQAAEAKRIDDALKTRNAEDLANQYIVWLQNDVGVSINQSALNQVAGGSQN
jgi:peptidyl-prolyl cis-trans isomerase D